MSKEAILEQWGELIPQGGLVEETFILNQETHLIGRRGDLKINNPKVSGIHSKLRYDKDTKKAYITDLSCNGTFLFNKKLIKDQETNLEHGDIIHLLKDNKQWIGYIFKVIDSSSKKDNNNVEIEDQMIPKQVEIAQKQEQNKTEQSEELKRMQEELQQKLKKIQEEDENFEKDSTCVICIDILYNPFMMTPCLHNYCCDCMTELTKQKEIVCPQCRVKPVSIQKNYPLKNMIETFIKRNPDKKWSEEIILKKEEKNELTPDYLSKFNEKLQGKTKKINYFHHESSSSEEDYSDENHFVVDEDEDEDELQLDNRYNNRQAYAPALYRPFSLFGQAAIIPAHLRKCKECEEEREDDKFKCTAYQVHIKCINCDQMMPQRNNQIQYPQNCTICEKSYCNLYFNEDCSSKYNSFVNYHLKLFKDLPIPQVLNASSFSNRIDELQVLEKHLEDPELRTIIIFEHMNEKFIKKGKFKYEINKKFMKTAENKSFDIESDTPICLQCWPSIWNQMVLKYRIDIQDELPQNIKNKPNCWHGINCHTRTPAHNQRFNHACEQTN